MFKFLKALPVA